jgi:hypothetical protein
MSARRGKAPPYVQAVFDAVDRAFEAGRYADALDAVRTAEAAHPHDAPLRLALAGVYIDAGAGLNDLTAINEGVGRLEATVSGVVAPADEYEAGLIYNLANGYAARQQVRRRAASASTQAGAQAPPQEALSLEDDTRAQKLLYRRALTVSSAELARPSPEVPAGISPNDQPPKAVCATRSTRDSYSIPTGCPWLLFVQRSEVRHADVERVEQSAPRVVHPPNASIPRVDGRCVGAVPDL